MNSPWSGRRCAITCGGSLLRRFFEVFLFEDAPAGDRRADDLYLDEARRCDVYLGLFGYDYGTEDASGLSPTEREFEARRRGGPDAADLRQGDRRRNPPPEDAGADRTGGRRTDPPSLYRAHGVIAAVYAALVRILEEREIIRFTPFDATFCRDATLKDLDTERITRFVALARRSRNFPLPEGTPVQEVLAHLNLFDRDRPTHAAVLLFGRQPQRFLPASEVRCAHFHGTEVAKPIPSYQVYKGTVFDLVDQAKDFVLSKIDLWVGTRAESAQAPTAYEIPQEVVAEAIVNAVCHRDYTSDASVQVMLFKDRLEIWNPGTLPPTLTLASLKGPHPRCRPTPARRANVPGQIHRAHGHRHP